MSGTFSHGHALIIGVGADLPNTIADAQGIAKILCDPDRCAYPPNQVLLLTGEKAGMKDILVAFDMITKQTDDEATVIVYFSGHGYQVLSTTGEHYYLMPYGYDTKQLYKTAISGVEFVRKLQAIPAKKLLILLDCCHAGGVVDATDSSLKMIKTPIPPDAQELLADGSGRVIIASSAEDELSYAGNPYSAFTLALIEALSGIGTAKKDGYVRVADLALRAREVVPARTKDRQHPILNFKKADNFVLAYYAGGHTEPKGLPFDLEPEIEPEPGAWQLVTIFDQRSQTVHGPQKNIVGNLRGPVFSGSFHGPVNVDDSHDSYIENKLNPGE